MHKLSKPSLELIENFNESWCPMLFSWIQNEEELAYWSGYTFKKQGFSISNLRQHIRRSDLYSFAGLDQNEELVAYGEVIHRPNLQKLSLCRLIIRPKCRGIGLGKRFCEQLISVAQKRFGKMKIDLNVLKKNQPALRCYLSLGFKITGIVNNARIIRGQGYDLVMMSKFPK